MENHQMEYNSQKEKLVISEYGRHIQNLILYAKTIEDDEQRQLFTEKIIELMHQMNPQSRNIAEYKERLWQHLFRIADYDIKVVPSSGTIPSERDKKIKPELIPYPVAESKFRHYGHNVQVMIKKAKEMEDEAKKLAYVKVIGAYMKLAYRTWNKEHYVNDEMIKEDLKMLSGGQLELDENVVIENLTNHQTNRRKKRNQSSGFGRSRPSRHRKRR